MLFGRSPSWIALEELRQCCISMINLKTMIPQGYQNKFRKETIHRIRKMIVRRIPI